MQYSTALRSFLLLSLSRSKAFSSPHRTNKVGKSFAFPANSNNNSRNTFVTKQSSTLLNMAATTSKTRVLPYESIDQEDPYVFLEEVESEESLNFAKSVNSACLEALGDPKTSGTGTYEKVLAILESDDRIPYVRKYGNNDDGDDVLFNLWKDGKVSHIFVILLFANNSVVLIPNSNFFE